MNIGMRGWGYALLCVILPTLWGLLIVWGTKGLEKRLQKHRQSRSSDRNTPEEGAREAPGPSLDYHI